jgi:hypothetical protein
MIQPSLTRRRIGLLSSPWIEIHGYDQPPRCGEELTKADRFEFKSSQLSVVRL